MHKSRIAPVLTALPDGGAVVTGGYGYGPPGTQSTSTANANVEVYDMASGLWSNLPDLQHGRFGHTATLFPGNVLLVVGGFTTDYASVLASTEQYQVSAPAFLYLPLIQH